MTFEDFCDLNGLEKNQTFVMMDGCVFPREPFTAEFTFVMYSSKGTASFSVDGKTYKVSRKSMSVFREGQMVEVLAMSEDFRCKVLLIGGDLGKELSVSSVFLSMFILNETPIVRVTSEYADATTLFFEAMERIVSFTDNPYKRECLMGILRAFFYSTGYFLYKSLRFTGTDIYRLSVDAPADPDSIVTRFISLVEANATCHRNLSFYAERLDYNPKYLSSLIKRETGRSGQDIIDQYAVLGAMAKLSYSHKSVKEISNEMDFPSQSDFGKFFKRMAGVSPLAYRKNRLTKDRF